MKQSGKILVPLALLITGTAIALLLFESMVRVFIKEPILPRYVENAGFGVRTHQANISTHHYMPGEYDIKITTNNIGMRGQTNYAVDKPQDSYRISLIGDSYVFGYGVNDEEVISAVLEGMLNNMERGDEVRHEVLNFGLPGFGQAEELITYHERVRSYNSDCVVLFYFENDIGNNMVSKLYKVNEEGKLERDQNEYLPGVKAREILYGIAPIRLLFEHSQGWNLIRNRLSALVQKSLLKEQGLKTFKDSSDVGIGLTNALILKFIEEIRADGATPIVFIIPQRTITSNFPLALGDIESAGAILVDGREILEVDHYYKKDSHWNASGHIKAAEALVPIILNNCQGG